MTANGEEFFDAAFECDAPRMFDFADPNESDDADCWFDCEAGKSGFDDDFVERAVKRSRSPPKRLLVENEHAKPKRGGNLVSSWNNEKTDDDPTERGPAVRMPRRSARLGKKRSGVAALMPQRIPVKKTTEELEMERIAAKRAEAKKAMQMSKDSFKLLAKSSEVSNSVLQKKSDMPATQPKEFHFHVEGRLRSHQAKRPATPPTSKQEIEHPNQFPKLLRSFDREPSTAKPLSSDVNVKPFSFACDQRKRQLEKTADDDASQKNAKKPKFVSVAAQVKKFESTPQRFRSRPKNDRFGLGKGPVKAAPTFGITMAKTPTLLTKTRARVNVESTEDKNVKEMKSHHFKATEVNPKIFDMEGKLGLPEKPESQLTAFEEFSLETTKRAAVWQEKTKDICKPDGEAGLRVFHAQPVPRNILEEVVGVPEKKEMKLTAPKTPNIKKVAPKIQISSTHEDTVDLVPVKPLPLPEPLPAFKPTLKHQHTKPEPFSFHGKYKDPLEVKAELAEYEAERLKKLREFQAKPLPSSEPFKPLLKHEVTESIEPFRLETENRGKDAAHKFMEKMKSEMATMRAQRCFKANPCDVIHNKPFEPQLVKAPLSVDPFVLNTELRSHQRQKLEEKKKQDEEERRRLEEESAAIRDKEEKENLKKYREALVHRAKPVPKGHAFLPNASKAALTEPMSPNLTRTLNKV